MGSLYVVSGRSFYRAFTISTTEDVNEESTHHKLENARKYLDKVWPFFKQGEFDTQGKNDADGQIETLA